MAKLNRAAVLMASLSLEKDRWIKASERLLKEKASLVGDTLIATAFVTYMGAFEGTFRERAVRQSWRILVQ